VAARVIRRWLSGILAALALLGAALLYRKGRKDADDANTIQEFNEYVATRKRMDAVDGFDDADAVRDWLRDRAKRASGL
jgi:hypothetical protein